MINKDKVVLGKRLYFFDNKMAKDLNSDPRKLWAIVHVHNILKASVDVKVFCTLTGIELNFFRTSYENLYATMGQLENRISKFSEDVEAELEKDYHKKLNELYNNETEAINDMRLINKNCKI